MKKALIHDTRVCQIVAAGEDFPVAPPLVWVDCGDDVTERHTYEDEVFVAPPPLPVPHKVYTPREFRARFTEAEQDAIDATAMTDLSVFKWRIRAAEAQEIDTTPPETIAGMDFLVARGLIMAERRDEILGS